MAIQSNNLMLLDLNGFPRTIDGATDSIGITTDVIIGGDLTVDGDIVSSGTMDIVVKDNFLDLSNGNVTGAKSGGLTVNVEANSNTNMGLGNGVTFESIASSATAFARLSIDGYNPQAAGIAAGDIIEISGLSQLGENNGLFVVQSVAAGAGTTPVTASGLIEIKNAQAASVPFAQTNFEDGAEVAGTLGFQLDLGIITISGGALPDGAGGTIPKGNFATGYAADATDAAAPGAGAITYGDAASISLQEAYDDGQSIQISNLGDLLIETDEVTPQNFIVKQGGAAFNYLQTDAATDTLVLGSMNGINPAVKVGLEGQINTHLTFDGAGPYSIANMTSDLIVGGEGLILQALGASAGALFMASSAGIGAPAVLNATNAYVGGASVAGDISGSITDGEGVPSALTITFGAGAANLAALIAGATVPATVVLSDDGGGNLMITSVASGNRLTFSINAESVGGVAASVGIPALPAYAGNGMGATQLNADNVAGDINLRSGRCLDMLSMNGSIEIKTQTAAKQISINAQSGTLELAGDTNANLTSSNGAVGVSAPTVNIDGVGVGAAVNIGNGTPGVTSVMATGLSMVAQDAFTLEADNASEVKTNLGQLSIVANAFSGVAKNLYLVSNGTHLTEAITLDCSGGGGGIKLDCQGGTATLDANNILLKTTAINVPIQMAGWVQQDFTQSAGMGIEVKVDSAVSAVLGEVFAFADTGGGAGTEAKAISASSPEAPGVCGAFLETKAVGLPAAASTVHGAVVMLSFDGNGNPGVGEVGTPVYLSSTLGKAAKTATQASGEHVIRLGFAHEAGTGRVLWAPQYIAKRP